jgi:hypothetical protein
MSRVLAELIPDVDGSGDFEAQFSGSINESALAAATEITIYFATAATNIEITVDGTNWVDTGTDTTANVTTIASPPACKGIRLAGVAAAATPPARVLVRTAV